MKSLSPISARLPNGAANDADGATGPSGHHWYALLLTNQGRFPEAYEEADRAYQFFQRFGEEYPREYDAPDPRTGQVRHGATFYHDFGKNVRAAASAAIQFFVDVCGFPQDVELAIEEN